MQLEYLALILEVLMVRPYLEGTRFTIRTDDYGLQWILNMSDATGKLARWRLRFSELEFDAVGRTIINPKATDGLYRMETSSYETVEMEDNLPTYVVETMVGITEEA